MKKYVSTGAVDVDHINDSDTEIVDYEGKPSRANLEAMAGDVLFAKMQGTKKTLMIDSVLEDYIYSTGFCAVRAKNGILTDRCLYHLLTSDMLLSQKDKNCSGATQKAITNAGLGKIVIRVPSIEMQNDIADQLDAVISIITKRQQELSALDELIKARFGELFGNPVINEKGWNTSPLNDVCDGIGDGLHGTPEYDIDGDYPFINGNNLMDGSIEITPATKMVDERTYKKHYIEITDNAILLSINGT
jgi:type I restriction enzyme S subunit